MSVTHFLADMSTRVDSVPNEALDVMRLSVLDWAACTIAGQGEPVAQAVRQVERENGGTADATVVGSDLMLPMRGAAMANGVAAHALDFDDTHFAHIGHPSAVIISAALAMAERQGDADGNLFLRAALVGAEASVRIGLWLGRPHYEVGFHQTATAGTIVAAVAGAAIFDLPMNAACSAIGLAATRAAGLKVQFGTMGKPYHAGMGAASAVEAVHAAMVGVDAAQEVLDGPFGFGATHHGVGDIEALTQDGMLFPAVSHKYHACCHGTHASIEAALSMRDKVDPSAIQSIEIKVHPRWLDVCAIPQPQTRLEAKFSLSTTTAMALLGYEMVQQLSFETDIILAPNVVALRDKVKVTGDATLRDTEAHVVLFTANQNHSAHHDLAQTAPYAERETRVRAKAEALLGQTRADAVWGVIDGPQGFDLTGFTSALRA